MKRAGTDARWQATRGRSVLDTFTTGTLAGAGSFRCQECGFHVALRILDQMPECPHCGRANFARTSMFDVEEPDTSTLHSDDDPGWLAADTVALAVQVNGKRRAEIRLPPGAPQEAAREAALAEPAVRRAMEGKVPRRVIVVPDKIVNVVV